MTLRELLEQHGALEAVLSAPVDGRRLHGPRHPVVVTAMRVSHGGGEGALELSIYVPEGAEVSPTPEPWPRGTAKPSADDVVQVLMSEELARTFEARLGLKLSGPVLFREDDLPTYIVGPQFRVRQPPPPKPRTAPARKSHKLAPKQCPFTGGACQHVATCTSGRTFDCWAREAYIDSQPDGPTGRHRDSMG